MRLCFFLQRSYAPLGDAIASILHDKYDVEGFSGYVQTRPALEYLKNDSLVQYSSLVFDEDVHRSYEHEALDLGYLRDLEKRIGVPNLWPYLSVDRTLMSGQGIREYPFDQPLKNHEDSLRILQVTAKSIEQLYDSEKPDAVVFPLIASMGPYLMYALARERGINTYLSYPALFQDRWVVSPRHDHFSLREEMGEAFFRDPSRQAMETARDFISSFRDTPRPYYADFTPERQQVTRARQFQFLAPHRFVRSVEALLHEARGYRGNGLKDDYSSVSPYNYLRDRAVRKIRNLRGVADLYDAVPVGENFAYFPLQYEPEAALLVQAPHITDQRYLVQQAARSLPVGWKLYVKEHPQMVPFRPRSFYEDLKKNTNMRLIDASTKNFGLIQNSRLMIVITGSTAFEATLLKKPVITLGNQFFNDFSFVKRCRAIEDLPQLVKEQVEDFHFDDDELIRYLGHVVERSAVVEFADIWLTERDKTKRVERIRPLADLLAKHLGLA